MHASGQRLIKRKGAIDHSGASLGQQRSGAFEHAQQQKGLHLDIHGGRRPLHHGEPAKGLLKTLVHCNVNKEYPKTDPTRVTLQLRVHLAIIFLQMKVRFWEYSQQGTVMSMKSCGQ